MACLSDGVSQPKTCCSPPLPQGGSEDIRDSRYRALCRSSRARDRLAEGIGEVRADGGAFGHDKIAVLDRRTLPIGLMAR